MDLFGIKAHDERHDNVERQLRRLSEQVSQLSIDLGVTRTQLRQLYLLTQQKVAITDVDPGLVAVNDLLKKARSQLEEAQKAREDDWAKASDDLEELLTQVRNDLAAADWMNSTND